MLPSKRVKPEETLDLSRMRNILVVACDQIGDAVLLSPFLRELRRNTPATITLVVKPAAANLVERCPYVDEVLTFNPSSSRYWWPVESYSRSRQFAQDHLASRNFDLSILPRWDADWGCASFVCYFSGARRRLGYSETVTTEKQHINRGYDRLLTDILSDDRSRHEVEHHLDVLRYLGISPESNLLEIWTTPEDEAHADALIASHGVSPEEPLVSLGIGAGQSKRLWPIERFREIARWLEQNGFRVIVVGAPHESQLGNALQPGVVNTAGHTTLRQMAALIKRCRLHLGNDSGPMHIAAAAGVPVIEISAHPLTGDPLHPNSPLRFHPWTSSYRVLQPANPEPPCGDGCQAREAHCISRISTEEVKQAVREQLSKGVHAQRAFN
jgi:lipopolysaccharide heptosyltransferase II